MNKINFSKLTGNFWICNNQEDIVIFGKKMYICKTDSIVCCVDNIPNARKVLFLPQNRLLVNGGRNTSYCMLSLVDGTTIWEIPKIQHMSVSGNRFALSPDGKYAYDSYSWKDGYHLLRIDLLFGKMDDFRLHEGFRTLMDIICDDNGDLLLLQTQYENTQKSHVSQNEIRRISLGNNPISKQEHVWEHDAPTIAQCFSNSGNDVLTRDLLIYNPLTNTSFSLIENDPEWKQPGLGPNLFWFDCKQHYIFALYDNANIVIDEQKRKIVACYAADFARGCLIENDYWVFSHGKLEIKSFPNIEDIPDRKPKILW